MRVAVTAQGDTLDAPVDPRFGRARTFLVVDTESGESRAVDNAVNLSAAQGAGLQTGKAVVDLGVEAVLTGHVGPKAFALLRAGGVRVYAGARGTVAEAIQKLVQGELEPSDAADVEGHWA